MRLVKILLNFPITAPSTNLQNNNISK